MEEGEVVQKNESKLFVDNLTKNEIKYIDVENNEEFITLVKV